MAKIFNVDSLAKEERSIMLFGKEHPVIEMTVNSYLATMAIAKELEKDENKSSQEAQVDAVLKTITLAVPTLDVETLKNLPFDQMNSIAQFVRGDVPDALKDAVEHVEVTTDETVAKKD